MIRLSWNESTDLRHTLRYAKLALHQFGHEKEACVVHEGLEKLHDIVNKQRDNSDEEK